MNKDGIVYADIDLSEMVTAKQFHDIIGHYTRMDVVSINLCQDEDQSVRIESRRRTVNPEGNVDHGLIRDRQDGQRRLSEELIQLRDLIGRMEK